MISLFAQTTTRLRSSFVLAAIAALWLLQGCGGGASTPPATPLSIVLQPMNASVPLGQPATFSVKASGPSNLTYQWKQNGDNITGATAASYSIPAVTASDAGAIFTVTVSDGASAVTSTNATLTIGPRSPATGDLRFQLVASPLAQGNLTSAAAIRFAAFTSQSFSNSVLSPLQLGEGLCVPSVPYDCGWGTLFYNAPAGQTINAGFSSSDLGDFVANLKATPTDTVVTTMDFESANDIYAVGYLQEPGMTFPAQSETSSLSALQAATTADGAAGRVVTAISFDAFGDAQFLSYNWSQDTTTIYETQIETASLEDIGAAATTLATNGYIITAFGGNPLNGYVMVGTRVKGDTIPRPILVFPPAPSATPTTNYATVAEAEGLPNASNPNGLYIFIMEQ